MAYKLIWSPAARDDLHDIAVFIARDNPNRAMSFGYELISETDRLREFAERGAEYESEICGSSFSAGSDCVRINDDSEVCDNLLTSNPIYFVAS
jgi:plasmid stabilization system protein ParE